VPAPKQESTPERLNPSLSRAGIPLNRRGGFGVDTASFTYGDGDFSGVIMDLTASVPVAPKTFLGVRLPLGLTIAENQLGDRTLAVLGNIPVEVRHVIRYPSNIWVTYGLALSLPTLSGQAHGPDNYEAPAAARAYWDLHELFPDIVPIGFGAAGEWHGDFIALRAEFQAITYFPMARNDTADMVLQHAIEVQFGHRVGGGFRLQGIWLPTFSELDIAHSLEGELYQAALEPFFAFEHRSMFMRLGIMMPLDQPLGPPFEEAWGFRFATGLRIE
jgi:hypothetical protein